MEPGLLTWGFFVSIMVPGCMTEFCPADLPSLRNAMFKILRYEVGTLINCDCKKGFRRRSPIMLCAGNSSHSTWENRCHCDSISSPRHPGKQVTPGPGEQKERKTTEMQTQMRPTDQANLPGHCEEPPPWEHEREPLKRIYHFSLGQTVHYQCMQGFRAMQGGSTESICKMIHGKMRWTWPNLKCISEGEDSQFPGDEEPQESMDAPPESETSFALTTRTAGTADFQTPTDVADTMDTFIFTTEYQIAVAGCVLLLISILLLSGLTWQRRWKKNRRTI
ncbi:interleukin-2 receptor subunit alpha [Hippopotamus amphibius kiboko]|uniref:interleukin-2 receptor subunit alpha n=1 Tax=Hippopotamus amphibius kiboko TaxID=575201 RepID=UPI002595C4B6|nr:interleukin-2 receptor subunit alpha [Hippopotamus amphibius kiboko]